jgi:hypothetical protein
MNHPGIKDLGDITVTAAGTQTTEWTDEPDGVTPVTSQARFAYRTGGTVAWSLSRTPDARAASQWPNFKTDLWGTERSAAELLRSRIPQPWAPAFSCPCASARGA